MGALEGATGLPVGLHRDTRDNYVFRFFRLLCEAGIGVCTAEAPFDAAQDRPRARSKISKFGFSL